MLCKCYDDDSILFSACFGTLLSGTSCLRMRARMVKKMQASHIITSITAKTVDHTLKAGESRILPSWTAALVYTP